MWIRLQQRSTLRSPEIYFTKPISGSHGLRRRSISKEHGDDGAYSRLVVVQLLRGLLEGSKGTPYGIVAQLPRRSAAVHALCGHRYEAENLQALTCRPHR